MIQLAYHHPPVHELAHPVAIQHGVSILVLREDLNHPTIGGNKWWKLKYNLIAAREQGYSGILTFGGAYSNHIYATAAACSELGFRSVGLIRGEEALSLNPTLSFAASKGMVLHYVSREQYRSRNDGQFIDAVKKTFPGFFIIPEGGTNSLAVKGCAELYNRIEHLSFDKLVVPVGTGGTAAGLIAGSLGQKSVLGVAVLKNGAFLNDEIRKLLADAGLADDLQFELVTDYHFGGYAKSTPELISFISEMRGYNLPLDHVYTAKLFFALFDMIKKGSITRGQTVLAIHTGGLQGSASLMHNSE